MAKIKLCGLFRECDIHYANEAFPDYAGFVFAESRRKIGIADARNYRKLLDPRIKAVGVFENQDPQFIQKLYEEGIIDIAQLHGDEDALYISKLKEKTDLKLVKAVRVKDSLDIERADNLDVDWLLLDAASAKARGGSGEMFDWSLVSDGNKPFFLAGGININNVKAALQLNPFSLDVSSGIETNGLKNREKMIEIVRKVRELR